MQIQMITLALVCLGIGAVSACYSCYSSPCYWCGGGGWGGGGDYGGGGGCCGGGGGGYYQSFPVYQPSYYGGGGSSSAAAAAASSSGYGGSSSAAAAASSSGGGWGSSSAAAAASSSSNNFGNYYWDVEGAAAQSVKDEKTACAVLVEQYTDDAIAPQELVEFVNKTFFGPTVKRNYTTDATPSTFHCCHAKYGKTLFKAGSDKARVVIVAGLKPVKIDYTVPVLPKGETCDLLITRLFSDVKKLSGNADSKQKNA